MTFKGPFQPKRFYDSMLVLFPPPQTTPLAFGGLMVTQACAVPGQVFPAVPPSSFLSLLLSPGFLLLYGVSSIECLMGCPCPGVDHPQPQPLGVGPSGKPPPSSGVLPSVSPAPSPPPIFPISPPPAAVTHTQQCLPSTLCSLAGASHPHGSQRWLKPAATGIRAAQTHSPPVCLGATSKTQKREIRKGGHQQFPHKKMDQNMKPPGGHF